MSPVFIKVIKIAVKARYKRGEGTLKELVDSYSKLSNEEKEAMVEQLRSELGIG